MNEGSSPLTVTVCFIHNISYTATFHNTLQSHKTLIILTVLITNIT